ncbi:MAG: AAA family ATPase [Verrucomicrobiales bacterium]|nr:AAA family ATPase [Verrucomicrobiales bacterium]
MNESYPFSAIVGMDLAKTSLLLHAVNPRLGGVLLSGHRGCAKTTLARAFAALLPAGRACELPLGASEDRLLGSVDVAGVLERNEWSHQAGLLEQADGGILYVDEVNLLPDALSDQLLDAAATGSYQLEREGMSRRIDSRFILVGTMNPEEGMLRPQLADRFAHTIAVTGAEGVDDRALIMERRLHFEMDAVGFCEKYEYEELALRQAIERAKKRLPQVSMDGKWLRRIAEKAENLSLEGMRGGLAVAKSAMAAAAWADRDEVVEEDVELAWLLCLGQDEDAAEPAEKKNSAQEPPVGKGGGDQALRSFVSLQPRTASEGGIEQQAESAGGENGLSSLLNPLQSSEVKKTSPSEQTGMINWKDTVLGWVRDARRDRLCRVQKRRLRHLWVFLDASRSSGADHFLARALTLLKQSLGDPGIHSLRVHVLRLSGDEISWMGRDMIPAVAERLLGEPVAASGGSSLSEALMELLRDTRRRAAGEGDAVLLFSDGIVTVPQGDCLEIKQHLMKRHLSRIARMGAQLLWCAPQVKRGFLHPVDTLGLSYICKSVSI